MQQILFINPENVSEEEVKTFSFREAARAIVFDGENNIALLHVANSNYYKLPGGGIEGSEDRMYALQRECLEEIGCEIDVFAEIGSIVEYRRIFSEKQISYCYAARVRGEKGDPSLTEEEMVEGFEPVWVTYEDALQLMKENTATNIEGRDYIVPRDIAFLREAKNRLM